MEAGGRWFMLLIYRAGGCNCVVMPFNESPLWLAADRGDPVWRWQMCFIIQDFFFFMENAALASGGFSKPLQQVWMSALFQLLFSGMQPKSWPPTSTDCNQWLQWNPLASSLMWCFIVSLHMRVCVSVHPKSLCFSIFRPIAQISHAAACLLPRAPSCNVAWRWCVSPVHARSGISRLWLAAKASQEGSRVNKVVRVQSLHFSFIHTLHMLKKKKKTVCARPQLHRVTIWWFSTAFCRFAATVSFGLHFNYDYWKIFEHRKE